MLYIDRLVGKVEKRYTSR